MEERGFFRDGLAFLTLRLNGIPIDALVDTGFSGDIMAPEAVVKSLGLVRLGVTWYEMADGRPVECSEYEGVLDWMGESRPAVVTSSNAQGALVGMGILGAYRVVLDGPSKSVVVGGRA